MSWWWKTLFTFFYLLGLMLLVTLTITHFFYCNHPEAECRKWPRNNLRAIFSLVLSLLHLLFESSHRNQAWPLAGVNRQVGRGQSVNLVTDVFFFNAWIFWTRPWGRCCLIGCRKVQSYCVFIVPSWKNAKKNHISCFVTLSCSLSDRIEHFLS